MKTTGKVYRATALTTLENYRQHLQKLNECYLISKEQISTSERACLAITQEFYY